MDHFYTCEQCGGEATLCVSDWGYIAALCDACRKGRKSYFKLPLERGDSAAMDESSTERRDSAPVSGAIAPRASH
jgi:hypothetical protein